MGVSAFHLAPKTLPTSPTDASVQCDQMRASFAERVLSVSKSQLRRIDAFDFERFPFLSARQLLECAVEAARREAKDGGMMLTEGYVWILSLDY